ncbi:MAG: TolC family protein [Candidatus Melainabacteria bacterium]|nr:TolC family protein [Candidatus Melainabacteria bacterium]
MPLNLDQKLKTLIALWLIAGSSNLTDAVSAQVIEPSPFKSAPATQVSPTPEVPPVTPTVIEQVEKDMEKTGAETTKPKEQPSLLGLVNAFNEALLKHPRVASVRAQLGIAKATYAQALTFPNPSLLIYQGIRAEATYQLGVSLPIEPPWKLVFRLLVSRQQVKQTDLEILNALWQLRNDVRRTYLELVVAQETAETLFELTELSRKLLAVAGKRFQAGDVPELDVLKARLATSQADIDYTQGQQRVVQAKQQLNIIMGRLYDGPLNVPRLPTHPFKLTIETYQLLPDFDKPLASLKELLAIAVQNRLELKIVNQAIKTTEAKLKSTYGNVWPNFQMNVGRSTTGNPPNGPKIKNGYFIGITQELPSLNIQQGDIAKFKSTIKQLRFELEAQKNLVVSQVSSAYQRLLAARERIRAYQEHVLADSNEVARLARRSYEVGQSDITATLAAQQANVQIRSQYLDAVRSYQAAFTDLEQSIGIAL